MMMKWVGGQRVAFFLWLDSTFQISALSARTRP